LLTKGAQAARAQVRQGNAEGEEDQDEDGEKNKLCLVLFRDRIEHFPHNVILNNYQSCLTQINDQGGIEQDLIPSRKLQQTAQ